MTDSISWMPWVGATGMGLFSSLTTGQIVGFAFSRKLPTFQLLFASFILAIGTWGTVSLLVGAVFWMGTYLWMSEWSDSSFGWAALGLLLGVMLLFLSLLIWRLRIADGRRWATAGAVVPWAVVSATSAGAFHWFSTTDTLNYQVPEYFWGCVFMSMAIGIILGSCAGGMIHHQTKHLRSSKP
jgi:hypothetical protein